MARERERDREREREREREERERRRERATESVYTKGIICDHTDVDGHRVSNQGTR